ncbi:MAG: hypothetical protein ABFD25_22450 [Clostridiaceae bacterium]
MKISMLKYQNSLKQRYYRMGQGWNSILQGYHSQGRKSRSLLKNRLTYDERGFGMNELLGIAAALIIAGFVVVPGLRALADSIMTELKNWWDNTIKASIFHT